MFWNLAKTFEETQAIDSFMQQHYRLNYSISIHDNYYPIRFWVWIGPVRRHHQSVCQFKKKKKKDWFVSYLILQFASCGNLKWNIELFYLQDSCVLHESLCIKLLLLLFLFVSYYYVSNCWGHITMSHYYCSFTIARRINDEYKKTHTNKTIR